MAMRDWFRRSKENPVGSAVAVFNHGRAVSTPRQYDRIANEGYVKNVVAHRCVADTAMAVSSVPVELWKGDTQFETHELLSLLKRPSPWEAGHSFVQRAISSRMISGNVYIVAAGPEESEPSELFVLRPDRMQVVPGVNGMPVGYTHTVNSLVTKFDVDPITGEGPVLHWKTYNPLNDWYGLAPMEAALMGIDVHNESSLWNHSLLHNAGRPSGAMVVKGSKTDGETDELTDTQYDRFKEQIDEKIVGARNAGSVHLFEGGVQWQAMGFSPMEMDWMNSRHSTARDICHPFNYPPFLLGIPGDNTYSNQREARLGWWEQSVIPITLAFYGELNNWLVPQFEEGAFREDPEPLELRPVFDNVSALALRREQQWSSIEGVNFLTLNEKRSAAGFGPVDGGGEIFISAGLLPLSFQGIAPGTPDGENE